MAQVATAAVPRIGQGVPSGLMPAGLRNVASVSASPVEPASQVGIAYEGASFLYQDYFGTTDRDARREREPRQPPSPPVVLSSSQAFAALLEGNQASDPALYAGVGSSTAYFQAYLPRAIELYESSARLGGGVEARRGDSFSFNL